MKRILTDVDIDGLYHASQGQTLREQDADRVRAMARAVEAFLTEGARAAPMNRSAGMRCPTCCAKVGEPHLPSCTDYENTKENH